jgi:2-amino-4-hydroxy-6-hydroxymethyldihydropteridine diphosphokinase
MHKAPSQAMAVTAYIGLGSNLPGDLPSPRARLVRALAELARLPQTQLLGQSPFYQSRAHGPEQPDYVNAVAALATRLSPLDLLDQLQALETSHQRQRLLHWGPRTLDLDLLLYGDQVLDLPRLKVPHPFMTQCNFVLYPLATLVPDLVLPCGTSLASLCLACPPDGLTHLPDVSLPDV